MTRDQIKAELRRSACEDVFPFAYVNMDALRKAFEYRCIPEWIGDLSCDDCRTFFLLVEEALE